ncbi:MAG: class A beta-lactamase [Pyrinomonadaceae bacterium]|nr:class A beta-lactamase [Pyrinomonadaceae bacterium]
MKIRTFICAMFLSVSLAACASSEKIQTANGGDASKSPTATPSLTPDSDLAKQFAEFEKDSKGKLGVYAVELETGRIAEYNAGERFALQSVVKVPISMAVMKMAVDGKINLDDQIAFAKDELVPARMHSPIRDENPNGGKMPLKEMIKAAVSVSDGTAADVLQRLAGGAAGVQAFIDSLGVTEMKVRYSHTEFAEAWERQYDNWSTPRAAVQLLRALWSQKPKVSADADQKELLLLTFMYETPTGPNRLKGLLPAGTPVAHKTGTGSMRDGVTSATNDVGIITMPNGNHVVIAVFLRDSSGDEKTREAAIARSANAVFDKWSAPAK